MGNTQSTYVGTICNQYMQHHISICNIITQSSGLGADRHWVGNEVGGLEDEEAPAAGGSLAHATEHMYCNSAGGALWGGFWYGSNSDDRH